MLRIITSSALALTVSLMCVADSAWPAEADDIASVLTKHKATTKNLEPWAEVIASGSHTFRADSAVYFALGQLPSDGKFVFPRLNNPTKRVYLLGKPDTELVFRPEVKEWIVTLPKELPAGAEPIVVVETIGRPHMVKTIGLSQAPEPVKPNDKGLLILPAHQAVTHGEKLRYEPQPHKNTIGYWTVPKDFAHWLIQLPEAGEYDVYVLQGCGQGQGGSDVTIHVRSLGQRAGTETSVGFVVQETGHFQNFVRRKVGSISIETGGVNSVEIRPDRLANKAVMDVREVRLVPK